MEFLSDAREFSVDEGVFDCLAGVGERDDLEQDVVADAQQRARGDELPVDTLDGEIFACGPDVDRMAEIFGTPPLDRLTATVAPIR